MRFGGSGEKGISKKIENHLVDEDQPVRRRGGPLNSNLDAMNVENEEKGSDPGGRESEKHIDPTPELHGERNIRGLSKTLKTSKAHVLTKKVIIFTDYRNRSRNQLDNYIKFWSFNMTRGDVQLRL